MYKHAKRLPRTHVRRSCSRYQSSVDYANTKMTQHAVKVSVSHNDPVGGCA